MNLDAILQIWDRVRSSLWFVPAVMAFGTLIVAAATPAIDALVPDEWLEKLPLVFSGRPVGARAVLSTIATSTITIAGVVFSMTIVSLQLASSQFGPRLLRTFLRDTGNQIVLGTFLSTFLYCIAVLPTVNSTDDAVFIPHIAVTIAVLAAIVSLAMLVYYIDHVAQSIHADAVIHAVWKELDAVVDDVFPEPVGDAATPGEPLADPDERDGPPVEICATTPGYLRFINGDALLEAARDDNLFISLDVKPGRFVQRDEVLARVWPATRVNERTRAAIRSAAVLGPHRTSLQDATFAFEQLAEMAQRALSPGINDPATANHCIERIAAGLCRIVTRDLPPSLRRDRDGVARVEAPPLELRDVLRVTVDPIARTAGPHFAVWLTLFDALHAASLRAVRPGDRAELRQQARVLAAAAGERFSAPCDAERIAAASVWSGIDP